MNKKPLLFLSVLGGAIAALIVGIVVNSAYAQDMPPGRGGFGMGGNNAGKMGMMQMGGGVAGKVTEINGTTLTVSSVVRSGNNGNGNGNGSVATSSVTYSVDASNATVRKGNATTTVSSIATGDLVMARGTVSGDSVTATSIFDLGANANPQGFGRGFGGGFGPGPRQLSGGRPSGTPPFRNASGTWNASGTRGMFTPPQVTSGTVAAVSGTTITLTGSNGTTYSVDASNATFIKQGGGSPISGVNVGDTVSVQGSVSGTAITAKVIIDGTLTTQSTLSGPHNILQSIRSFLANIFHF